MKREDALINLQGCEDKFQYGKRYINEDEVYKTINKIYDDFELYLNTRIEACNNGFSKATNQTYRSRYAERRNTYQKVLDKLKA